MRKLSFAFLLVIPTLVGCGSTPSTASYEFTFNGTNCSASSELKERYKVGEPVAFTITPETDYILPAKEDVDVEGLDSFEYTINNNIASFSCTMPANEVEVVVEATDIYEFTFNGTNCSASSELKERYKVGEPVAFTITPETDYILPAKEDVDVEGLDSFEYTINNNIASFSCTMPANEVNVTIGAANTYKFIFNGINCSANSELKERYKAGATVAFTITRDSDCLFPQKPDVKVSGITDFTYICEGNEATFSCIMPTNEVEVRVEATPIETSNYLCFTNNSEGEHVLGVEVHGSTNPNLEYSVDRKYWIHVSISGGGIYTFKNKGESIYLRGNNPNGLATNTDWIQFNTKNNSGDQADFSVSGNIMSLLDTENFYLNKIIPCDYCFRQLFADCDITDASKLLLPATTLKEDCYLSMFNSSSLTKAPALNAAEELFKNCYANMFNNCDNLVEAPNLPSMMPAELCYSGMFKGCDNLVTVHDLPATMLNKSCYYEMFSNCTALEKAPAIEATILAENCCQDMFNGCVKLTTPPMLKAEELAEGCYYRMFYGCSSLIANTLEKGEPFFTCPGNIPSDAVKFMFRFTGHEIFNDPSEGEKYYYTGDVDNDCLCFTNNSKSGGALSINCGLKDTPRILEYSTDKQVWTRINPAADKETIKIHDFHTIGESIYIRGNNPNGLSRSTNDLVKFVTSSTTNADDADFSVSGNIMSLLDQTFFEDLDVIPCEYCFSYLFENCDITDVNNLRLPAKTLNKHCYGAMFIGCTKLTSVPYNFLPVDDFKITLYDYCYEYMFCRCTSLVQAPELPSMSLSEHCYDHMFSGCTSLVQAPDLPCYNGLASCCYYQMFMSCTSLTKPPIIGAISLATDSCYAMFYDCSSLNVNNEGSGTYFFKCPDPAAKGNAVKDMFHGTKGYTDDPLRDVSYFYSI